MQQLMEQEQDQGQGQAGGYEEQGVQGQQGQEEGDEEGEGAFNLEDMEPEQLKECLMNEEFR